MATSLFINHLLIIFFNIFCCVLDNRTLDTECRILCMFFLRHIAQRNNFKLFQTVTKQYLNVKETSEQQKVHWVKLRSTWNNKISNVSSLLKDSAPRLQFDKKTHICLLPHPLPLQLQSGKACGAGITNGKKKKLQRNKQTEKKGSGRVDFTNTNVSAPSQNAEQLPTSGRSVGSHCLAARIS